MSSPIYLDYNATTPLHPEVSKAIADSLGMNYFDGVFGNPSSTHCYGHRAFQEISTARQNLADLFGCSPTELIFTSCGSESNNMSILGACEMFKKAHPDRQCEILVPSVEHPSIKECYKYASEKCHVKIKEIPVDCDGQIDPQFVLSQINENTSLVTIMFANNEVGTLLNVPETFRLIREKRGNSLFPLLHTDCAQAIGKVPVKVDLLQCDLMSIAGHKFYGPKGVGALYVRNGLDLPNVILHGAGQENCKRPGTENILGIIGIGKAAEVSNRDLKERLNMQCNFVKVLHRILTEKCQGKVEIKVNGFLDHILQTSFTDLCRRVGDNPNAVMELGCLPGTLSISFKAIEAIDVLKTLCGKVCTSVGSACHSKQRMMSPVLKAMGIEESFAFGTFRISVGCGLTTEMVETAAQLLAETILSQN